MEWISAEPKFGDIIRTKVSFYYHYGIFADPQTVIQFGLPDDVNRPADQIKVLTSDIYAFLMGGELEVGKMSRAEVKKSRSAKEIVDIALSRLGEGGYHIFHNNCEHFVYECAFNEKKSEFVSSVRDSIRKKLGKK